MIFIHNHRTGGTTIGNLLREEMGNKLKFVSQHGNAKGPEVSLLDKHPDYLAFGFVRNPWDRLLSWFHYLNRDLIKQPIDNSVRMKFEIFLKDLVQTNEADPVFHLNQLNYFTDARGNLRVQKIGRFESFESDINRFFTALGFELYEIPTLNDTAPKNYHDYYSDEARAIVARACRGDVAYFDYKF